MNQPAAAAKDAAASGVSPAESATPTPSTLETPAPTPAAVSAPKNPSGSFVAIFALMVGVFLCVIAFSNRLMAPWLHVDEYKKHIAQAMNAGLNYSVHDLNVDIRGIRQEHIALMERTPDIMILGASHWQEAHGELTPGWDIFNAHVHRDYYDDYLAMVEVLLVNDKLPNHLIIAIRDATFTEPGNRTDALWHPFIEEFRDMEARLDLDRRAWIHDFHLNGLLDLFSVSLGLDAFGRWTTIEETPGPTVDTTLDGLDVLLADGSIQWSKQHLAQFTFTRAVQESLAMAENVLSRQHSISPEGVVAVDKLLAFLQEKGVGVTLVHPPFNPSFYAMIEGSHYERHLENVHQVTVDLAEKYGMGVASSFDPRDVGCLATNYIDSEHGRPACLKKVLTNITQVIAMQRDPYGQQPKTYPTGTPDPMAAGVAKAGPSFSVTPRAVAVAAAGATTAVAATIEPTAAEAAPARPALVPIQDSAPAAKDAPATPKSASSEPPPPAAAAPPPTPPKRMTKQLAMTAPQSTTPAAKPADPGGFVVQVASFKNKAAGPRATAQLNQRYDGILGATDLRMWTTKTASGGSIYSIRTPPMASFKKARTLCRSLKRAGQDCLVIDTK